MRLEDVIRYFTEIVDAIEVAHKLGICHHDLKSTTILVDHQGRIKVLEFGPCLAECEMPGTLFLNTAANYRAPECIYRRLPVTGFAPWDERVDIFSLGVLLYEMVTGRRPFDRGHFRRTEDAISQEEPPSPTLFRANVPIVLLDIIDRALQKDVKYRYSSTAEIIRDLAKIC